MAEVGRGPLLFIANQLQCGACLEALQPALAGAPIEARYQGPQLLGITIKNRAGGVAHECDSNGRHKPKRAPRKPEADG